MLQAKITAVGEVHEYSRCSGSKGVDLELASEKARIQKAVILDQLNIFASPKHTVTLETPAAQQ